MVTLYVVVIVIIKTEWWNLVTDAKIAIIVIVIIRRDRYKSSVLMEIEQILNDGMVLRNISDADLLGYNDDECRHQIVILLKSC